MTGCGGACAYLLSRLFCKFETDVLPSLFYIVSVSAELFVPVYCEDVGNIF